MTRASRWLVTSMAVALAATAAYADETGRTDGTEGSEYGKGGNPFSARSGRGFVGASFGSGFFAGSRTGLLYGAEVGYDMDDWISLTAGYTYLTDRELSLVGVGTTLSYPVHPFVYNIALHAGIYAPSSGGGDFGLGPGAGVDILLSDRVRLGLNYRHDYIFTDTATTDMNRAYVGLKVGF